MKTEFTIDIDRPRAEVFAFLDDPENLPKIVPTLIDQGVIEETPEKVGTTFWHVYEEEGRKMKMTGVVTDYAEPERMAVSLDGAMFWLKVDYRFEELGPNSTRLIQCAESEFKHVFKLFGLLFKKKVKEMECEGEKAQAENFARMKAILEGTQ